MTAAPAADNPGIDRGRRATYRLQLGAGFDLHRAAELVDYLADLGVSHVYVSPILQAAHGSTHGYDTVDPTTVSAELGGHAGLTALSEALRRHGMRLLVDIVPNHMATNDPRNVWWYDVLEDGSRSPFARFFDIDWSVEHSLLEGRILVPILGELVGRAVDHGDLIVVRDGGLFLRYFDQRLPLSPESVAGLLSDIGPAPVMALANALKALPAANGGDLAACRHRRAARLDLGERVAEVTEAHAASIDATLDGVNADHDGLDALLARQMYRLAHWRAAAGEVNYRRFFDVTTLVALREEDEATFTAVHEYIVRLVSEGVVDGLRIDHIDGLRLPRVYLERLRAAVGDAAWLVVEKILGVDESLPPWPVAGTTGYEFANIVLAVLVDGAGEAALTETYVRLTGDTATVRDTIHRSKRDVMDALFTADIARIMRPWRRVCSGHPRHRHHSASLLETVVVEFIAALAVYRTYVDAGGASDADRAMVARTVGIVHQRNPEIERDLLDFFGSTLLGDGAQPEAAEVSRRTPQMASAVAAKGVEDTAFYRYLRLVALNEVGGDPGRFGAEVSAFHQANTDAVRRPQALLATSTHDTKRSEDVRVRIALLSEIPGRWAQVAERWMGMVDAHARGGMPDLAMRFLLLQTLVGAHPLDADRAVAYMRKASCEAKIHTSWLRRNARYDGELERFVRATVGDSHVVTELQTFVAPLVRWGRIASLSQVLLKLTSPGVPDIYQGQELWDLSLVDPDNRRPVDYAERRRLLTMAKSSNAGATAADTDRGLEKLLVTQRALSLRSRLPDAFAGAYTPLASRGARDECVVGFMRGGAEVAVVVPRLVTRLDGGWGDTGVELPDGTWHNEVTGRDTAGGMVALADLLADFPVALLARRS